MGRPNVRVVRPQSAQVIRPRPDEGARRVVKLETERADLSGHRDRLLERRESEPESEDFELEPGAEEIIAEEETEDELAEPIYSPPPAPASWAMAAPSMAALPPMKLKSPPAWVWVTGLVVLGSVLFTGWSLYRKVTR